MDKTTGRCEQTLFPIVNQLDIIYSNNNINVDIAEPFPIPKEVLKLQGKCGVGGWLRCGRFFLNYGLGWGSLVCVEGW